MSKEEMREGFEAWAYCPECGCEDVRHEEGEHKQCAQCHQEWFSSVDYSDVVRKHLSGKYIDKDVEIERLRAELGECKGEYDRAVNKVDALRDQLAEAHSLFADALSIDVPRTAQSLERMRSILSASAEPTKPGKVVWIGMEDLPEHEVGARYRMILDDVPQECTELEKEGSKRWFWGEGNGAFPIDEIQAWLPIAESAKDDDWHMNPCKQGHRDVGAAGGVAHCYQCDEKIVAATTQEAFEQWNATHPETQTKCKVHSQYKAIRKPTADCEACRQMWSEKQAASAEPANKESAQ